MIEYVAKSRLNDFAVETNKRIVDRFGYLGNLLDSYGG